MLETLVVIYLGGWMAATLAVYEAGRRFSDRRSPPPHPLGVSIVAGSVWPLLVLGLVELSSVVMYTKVRSRLGPRVGIFA
jgi:hypothetical protein